jgi:hypothetical protein
MKGERLVQKRRMIYPLDTLLNEGSWIVAAPDEPLLQPERETQVEWSIEMPADHAAWIPFHLVQQSSGVGPLES